MSKYKYGMVSVDDLVPNEWNTNVVDTINEDKLDKSIKRFGVFKPIIVRETEGTLQIIGGEHRWKSAKRLGYKEVPIVNVGPVSDQVAQEISLVDNGRYGSDDTLKLAELLTNLGDVEEIASFMPFDESELFDIFSSMDVNLDNLDLDDEEEEKPKTTSKPVQTHQIFRFKIPVGDSDRITNLILNTMKEQGFVGDDDLTNAGDALVYLLSLKETENE